MRAWLLGMIAGLTAGSAMAADLPVAPPSPMIETRGASPTRAAFAQTLRMGKLKFDLAEDRLSDVVKLIGAGTIGRMGDGGEVLFWACYTLPHTRVWLAAGESETLDTVTAQVSNAPPSASCPALPASYQAISLDGAIWLNMSEADLTRRLGPAGKSAGGWQAWRRDLTMAVDKIDEYDGLAARIDGGRVIFLQMQRARSY